MNAHPKFYMAPMLGITDASFRTAFMQHFGGFDTSIAPFVRTMQGQRFKRSGVVDLDPLKNTRLPVIPQILTNQVDDFIHLANVMFDLGYPNINLNMGCPVPTASGKGRGAGLLPEIELVDRMLDAVLSVIPSRLSVKTRVGFNCETELLQMSAVFNRYPLQEVMIHPRTALQKYKGSINHEAFSEAVDALNHQIVYSGDIFTKEDYESLSRRYPKVSKWMIGRGILKDPNLALKIAGKDQVSNKGVVSFLETLAELYRKRGLSEHIVLQRLRTLLVYLGVGHKFTTPVIRRIRKSKDFEVLIAAVSSALE
ncbi:tRNA-dihydrouridine synthase family protein [Oligoflexaceae bacterium]|nr:tRNA-dihydrouridine synthase family protein [Oligoflexaceae bacterium]